MTNTRKIILLVLLGLVTLLVSVAFFLATQQQQPPLSDVSVADNGYDSCTCCGILAETSENADPNNCGTFTSGLPKYTCIAGGQCQPQGSGSSACPSGQPIVVGCNATCTPSNATWSTWSGCSASCTQTRTCNNNASCGGSNTCGGGSSRSCTGGACVPPLAACEDGIDNDNDGLIDCTAGSEDPGCFPDGFGGGGSCDPTDTNETDVIPPQCSDGIDNDNDGLLDCSDPGCLDSSGTCDPTDDNETDDPRCSDGIDNDNDGLIDCTPGSEDPGCFPDGFGGGGSCDPTDDSEVDVVPPQCNDGIDNDSDGLIDCSDPGCLDSNGICDSTDDNESDAPECNDGLDNDNDGLIDCTPGSEDLGCFPDGLGGGGACNPNDDTETDTVDVNVSGNTPLPDTGLFDEGIPFVLLFGILLVGGGIAVNRYGTVLEGFGIFIPGSSPKRDATSGFVGNFLEQFEVDMESALAVGEDGYRTKVLRDREKKIKKRNKRT